MLRCLPYYAHLQPRCCNAAGQVITDIFLTEYRSFFPQIRVTTRDPTSEKAQNLSKKGVAVFKFDPNAPETLDPAFAGTDVIINQTKNYLQTRIIYYVMKLHIRPRSIWLSRVSSLRGSHFSDNTH